MCLQAGNVVSPTVYNWEGDAILYSPVIESARYVPGSRRRYPIDIREFLATAGNAVVHRALADCAAQLPGAAERECFGSRERGSFDHRVRTVCAFLSRKVTYQRRAAGFKQWLFPDETLAKGGGDCEDHAFLLASLLLASGISGYVVRVALGELRNQGTGAARDHAWVMYKNEAGSWLLLDPLIYTAGAHQKRSAGARLPDPDRYAYEPRFVFNDSHLWAVRAPDGGPTFEDYCAGRDFWHSFDPAFAAEVHDTIFDAALAGMPWADLQYVKAVSLAVDANLATYDPVDHFDNGYLEEGWARVAARLGAGTLEGLALAGHAIGDFYAHSSWGVFGQRAGGALSPLLDPAHPVYDQVPDYRAGGRYPLEDPRFSVNAALWPEPRSAAPALWAGRLISGRYAQNGDPRQGTLERLTWIPKALRDQPGFRDRGSLPHHDEVAVDSPAMPSGHRLYPDPGEYGRRFLERRDAATAHVKAVYAHWRQG